MTTQQDNNNNNNSSSLTVGRLVEVRSRTWPGINKPGGIARISCVHFCLNDSRSDSNQENVLSHVDVHYVVGRGKEKRVPVEYVTLAPQYERNTASTTASTATNNFLRDRSMLLGRCRRCGSLRTDCGSCDWAAMEQALILGVRKQQQQPADDQCSEPRQGIPVKKYCAQRPTTIRQPERSQMPDDDDHESSEEEEILLQELMTQNKQRYRDYLRRRSRWEQLNDCSSSSDEDSAGGGEDATAFNDEIGKGSSKAPEQQKDDSRVSVLEKLGQKESSSHISERRASRLASRRRRRQARTKSLFGDDLKSTIPSKNYYDSDAERIDEMSDCTSFLEDVMPGSTEELIVLFSSSSSSDSSPERTLRQLGESDSTTETMPLPIFTEKNRDGDDNDRTSPRDDDSTRSITLSQFIQPEGKDAAENLPEDTYDRTRSLLYRELPKFFDDMATNLEVHLIPDAKLRLAEQQKNWTELHCKDGPGADNDLVVVKGCQKLWLHLRQRLIRDGTDQCRAAIRRLMDDKLYRKHKKSLTHMERKRLRSVDMLDARNIRMDTLDDMVEELVRKVNHILHACSEPEDVAFHANDESEEASGIDSACSGLEDDPQTQDLLVRSNVVDRSFPVGTEDERVLPPFRPHMYARRARKRPSAPKLSRKRTRGNTTELRTTSINQAGDSSTQRRRLMPCPHSQHRNRDQLQPLTFREMDVTPGIDFENSTSRGFSTEVDSLPALTMGDPVRIICLEPNEGARRQRRPSPQLRSALECSSRSDRLPISERMQVFLDANTGEGTTFSSSTARDHQTLIYREYSYSCRHHRKQLSEAQKSDRRHQRVTGRKLLLLDQAKEGEQQFSTEKDEDGLVHSANYSFITVEELYLQLRNGPNQNQTVSALPPHGDFARCCQELRTSYPQFVERCEISLDGIRALLDVGVSADLAASFLTTSLELLQDHGTATLQELITDESPHCSIHIRLLVECLHALQPRFNVMLGPENGVVHKVFARSSKNFVDFLLLQLVDSAYSLFHPLAWALQLKGRGRIIKHLNQLRDALAGVTSLAESVCRCISEDLGCQEWRSGYTGHHVFVSSVCPEAWKSFLRFGQYPTAPQQTRLAALSKPLPRIEVETVWKLLAYFGVPKSLPAEPKSIVRWQVISKLFVTVFQTEQSNGFSSPLPPSDRQMLSCEREIGYLADLLFAGSLDNLPATDTIVTNVIQRSLTIQSDCLLTETGDESSSLKSELDKNIVESIWKASHPIRFGDDKGNTPRRPCSTFHSSQFLVCGDGNGLEGMVLPSSAILGRCLALLLSWVQRVPSKKARQCRLLTAISELVKSLLGQAERLESIPRGDSFQAMFSTTASNRSPVFLREAASLIFVVYGHFKAGEQELNSLTAAEQHEVWNIVANDSMRKYCVSLSTGLIASKDILTYNGCALRPYMAAKVMTFLTLAQMGVSPWTLSSGSEIVCIPLKCPSSGEADPDALVFPVTCLFACLNSLCDLECESAILTHVYSLIAVVYTNATATLASSHDLDHRLRSSIVRLGKISPGLFMPTLVKCYQYGMRLSNRSHLDNAQFRSLLSTLRGLVSLGAHAYNDKATSGIAPLSVAAGLRSLPNEVAAATDEVWGDLDDDAFVAIDLGDTETRTLSHSMQNCRDGVRKIWSCLAKSVDSSKPSKRFAISNHSVAGCDSEAENMSFSGKALVGRNLEKICECLVDIVALDRGNQCSLGERLNELLGQLISVEVFGDDNGDPEYCATAARQICSSLCSLAPVFSNCQSTFSSTCQNVLFNAIGTLSDFSTLDSFPTSNVRRLSKNGGEEAAQRALALLTIVNGEGTDIFGSGKFGSDLPAIQRKRRKKADAVWKFCHSFGVALHLAGDARHDDDAKIVGATLLDQAETSYSEKWSQLQTVSMEMEGLKRFSFLRAIVSRTATFSTTSCFNFERISSLAIATCLRQILRIAHSLQYHDSIYDGKKEKNFLQAKLVELLSTASVVTISLLSWILRETRHKGSDEWEALLDKIRDQLFSQNSLRRGIDTGSAISQIIDRARSVFSRVTRRSGGALTAQLAPYITRIFESVVHRSRQLIVHAARVTAEGKGQGLVNQLLTSFFASEGSPANDEISWAIACSFQVRLDLLPRPTLKFHSPLEEAIDECIDLAEMASPLEGNASLERLKRHALGNVIAPRLNHKKTCLTVKRRALLLSSKFFEADKRCGTPCSLSSTEALEMLSLLAKGIRASLRTVLAAKTVNDDFAATVFICFKSLLNYPVRTNGVVMSLIQWSRANCADLGWTPELGDTSIPILYATYIWIVIGWIFAIGKLIANSRDDGEAVILSFRDRCSQSLKESPKGTYSESAPHLVPNTPVWSLDSSLHCLERMLFPNRQENNAEITNVYSKSKYITSEGSGDEPLEAWEPSSTVVQRAKEFMSEVIPMC